MPTYCKLKNGEMTIIFGESSSNETYDVYPIEKEKQHDTRADAIKTVSWTDVAQVDTNLSTMRKRKFI